MKKLLFTILFTLVLSGSASAKGVIGKKLLCRNVSNDVEYGIHFNRPKTLLEYWVPFFYEGMTEKELKKVNVIKREYNPSPKTIYMWRPQDINYMYELNRKNLEIHLQNPDRSTKLTGQCQIMKNSFDIK